MLPLLLFNCVDYIRIFRKAVRVVSLVQPFLKPAQKVLPPAAGLDAHIGEVPDFSPARSCDNQAKRLAAAYVNQLQIPVQDRPHFRLVRLPGFCLPNPLSFKGKGRGQPSGPLRREGEEGMTALPGKAVPHLQQIPPVYASGSAAPWASSKARTSASAGPSAAFRQANVSLIRAMTSPISSCSYTGVFVPPHL